MFFFNALILLFTHVLADNVQRHLVITPRPGRLQIRKTLSPTSTPTRKPSRKPALKPTRKPSRKPALKPTRKPTGKPATPLDEGCPSNATDADKSIACDFIGIPDLKQCINATRANYMIEIGAIGLGTTLPSQLGLLSNLRQLSIMTFNYTVLPTTIGCLTKLQDLLIVFSLIGEIPSSLGSLTQLTRLSLNYNLLTGTIPSSLASLTNLNELSLDSNDLRGTLPATLCDLGLKPIIDCDEVECNCCYFCDRCIGLGVVKKCE